MTSAYTSSLQIFRGLFIVTQITQINGAWIIGTSKMSFDDASDYCQKMGRELLSIHSDDTQEVATSFCGGKASILDWNPSCWIGLHQPASGNWEWTDGSETDYGFNGGPTTGAHPWNSGQPDNFLWSEDCVELSSWYEWNDVSCSSSKYPICGDESTTLPPTMVPTKLTPSPTKVPTEDPTYSPTALPTLHPSLAPTMEPSASPTKEPTGSPSNVPTTTPTRSPSISPTNAPSVTATFPPTRFPSNAPTNVPSSVSPTKTPTNSPTGDPSEFPTFSPSNEPTSSPTSAANEQDLMIGYLSDAPSQSPTSHPIAYSNFESEVIAFFAITGWQHSEISHVNDVVSSFFNTLTTYIHQGFDNDDNLEYRLIVPNVTSINEYTLGELLEEDDSKRYTILEWSIVAGMSLQYQIECSHTTYCEYISGDGSSLSMEHSVFESFVTNKLRSYFTSTDAENNHAPSALNFIVKNMTLGASVAMEDQSQNSGESVLTLILVGGGALCLFISGVSVGVILYHRKRKRSDSAVAAHASQLPQIVNAQSEESKKDFGQSDTDIVTKTEEAPGVSDVIPHAATSCYGEIEGMNETEMGIIAPMNTQDVFGKETANSEDVVTIVMNGGTSRQ